MGVVDNRVALHVTAKELHEDPRPSQRICSQGSLLQVSIRFGRFLWSKKLSPQSLKVENSRGKDAMV